ncbi:hypothetical protein JZ751_005428 [Albula glossodonta]|uniref:GTP-binding protein 10 n=1 Tax=Albula glossodonta TaxID=121402 RepID=A0A8T2MYA1_9TELE|nr:hypothetical protein JZ751_005428 [Albula glossodonta]
MGDQGEDLNICAPPGIIVTTDEGAIIGELNADGDRVLVARGGRGGSHRSDFLPSKGRSQHIRLDLRLIADMGLVGFPNAGKSSLLSVLSHAKPQIADYAFTTMRPEIGRILYEDHRQVSIADLPGLIEGAHMNKGMGHKFLKHVERTKQLMFVELELYKEELLSKPALLVVNKMDLPETQEKLQELLHQLKYQEDFVGLLPEDMVPKKGLEFEHVVPVSAATGQGIEELKARIRQSLDVQIAGATEELHKERIQELQKIRRPPGGNAGARGSVREPRREGQMGPAM